MEDGFDRFGGLSAILVGILSLLYAFFYLIVARRAEYTGLYLSWVILAASGIFTSAAYVTLYGRLKAVSTGAALWAAALGVGASFATLVHGGYEALTMSRVRAAEGAASGALQAVSQLPSQIDPAGLAAFGVVGLSSFVFGWLIVKSGRLSRGLGWVGLLNAGLLAILFLATAGRAQRVILLSGGLTSVIVGPIWWIWLGAELMRPTGR